MSRTMDSPNDKDQGIIMYSNEAKYVLSLSVSKLNNHSKCKLTSYLSVIEEKKFHCPVIQLVR